jgi:hypothetical protein
MTNTFMSHTFRTICMALIAGLLGGAGTAGYVLATGAHGKIGLEFDRDNGSQHMELGHLPPGDATGRPPRFWGLQVGNGDSLTTIGVYSDRTATGANAVAPTHTAKLSPRLPE